MIFSKYELDMIFMLLSIWFST